MQKSEAETVALNIMVVRKRLGNKWELTWDEYKKERTKDGNWCDREKPYFDQLIELIPDAIGAISFSPAWAEDARRAIRKLDVLENVDKCLEKV